MRIIQKTLISLSVLGGLLFPKPGLHAQPVMDLPVSDFNLPILTLNLESSFPETLQVGDLETGIINPVTGEPLNDVAFVFGPLDTSVNMQNQLTVRFFTLFHTSATDTRALSLSSAADLIYPLSNTNNISFEDSTSVQILDLNRDGQNDLAFNGITQNDCLSWECGPSPIVGALGTGSEPFVAGNVAMLGQTVQNYSFPSFLGFPPYSGQPSLASGDMDGDGNPDLAINDWRIPLLSGQVGGAANAGQLLRSLLNDGSFGILPSVSTLIDIPDPNINALSSIPHFIVTSDFDMDGIEDAAVVYIVEPFDAEYSLRLMVYSGNGDGTFNPNPTISQEIAQDIGNPFNGEAGPSALAYGDFDGNGHLDFAVAYTLGLDGIPFVNTQSFAAVITCTPGSPPSCTVQQSTFPAALLISSLDAGDFNGDGLDDLVQLEALCTQFGAAAPNCLNIQGQAGIYLNQSGSFSSTADQTIIPAVATGNNFLPIQVIARDIDGCSPEDIALTGVEVPQASASGPLLGNGRGIVAFATAEDPVADAGTPVSTNGGFQLGGNPTCFDPNGNPISIQWTQISGPAATIDDPTAANPIVTGLSGDSIFQVTCQTACGQASDTVTVDEGIFLQGSGEVFSCAINGNSPSQIPVHLGWMSLAFLIALGGYRMRARKN